MNAQARSKLFNKFVVNKVRLKPRRNPMGFRSPRPVQVEPTINEAMSELIVAAKPFVDDRWATTNSDDDVVVVVTIEEWDRLRKALWKERPCLRKRRNAMELSSSIVAALAKAEKGSGK